MAELTATERDNVEKLADAFMVSYREGRCPSVEEFADQYPELADELCGLLKAMVILEQNVPPSQHRNPNAVPMAAFDAVPRRIGDFLVVREIGRGGMGVVYEAVQQSLGRQVALKVLSSPGLLNPSRLERFRHEAQAAARLQHSHIVPVFGFGAHDGTHYYAMQFIPGQSLDLVIDSLRDSRTNADRAMDVGTPARASSSTMTTCQAPCSSSVPEPEKCAEALSDSGFSTSAGRRQFYHNVARLGLQAVEALAYAHSAGVLHRDIKPSNLLLDGKGNIWITDFGLAKTEGADPLTQTGDFVGTLRYMAPERLEGWSDRRSDLYGLGVTLYELLTLKPFFANDSRAKLLRCITEQTPPPPRRIDPAIPIDLETIVLKSVAKEPAARYHRAEDMAEDLRRFLADRPILARRSTALERTRRWCRRNPVVALLTTMVVALMVMAMVILALSNAQIRRESAAKEAALADRETALRDKDEALSQVWLYRGMYGVEGEQAEALEALSKAVKLAPNSPEMLWFRGFTLGGYGHWNEALTDMTAARRLMHDSESADLAGCDWFIAMAYVANGDRSAYQAACRAALGRMALEPNFEKRGKLLWMCTVTPYALDDPSSLADFVPLVLPPNGDPPTSDQLLIAGAALFRANRLSEAQEYLERTIRQIASGKPTADPMSEIYTHLFLGMTYSRLEMADEAKASLREADHLAESIKPQCWVDELQQKVLTEEARAMTDGAHD